MAVGAKGGKPIRSKKKAGLDLDSDDREQSLVGAFAHISFAKLVAMVAAGLAVIIAYRFQMIRRETTRVLAAENLPIDLQTSLTCNFACRGTTTQWHEQDAKAKISEFHRAGGQEEDWLPFVEEVCIDACHQNVTAGRRPRGERYTSASELPALQRYMTCTSSCHGHLVSLVSNEFYDADVALDTLHKCGLAHVPLDRSSSENGHLDLVQLQMAAYNTLQSGIHDREFREAFRGQMLRNGREETWLPHELPFSRFAEFLSNTSLGHLVQSYFGDRVPYLSHVNVLNAPGRSRSSTQDLHTDTEETAGKYLELHVPLFLEGPLPLKMGPPRFCPCAHELRRDGNVESQALMDYFIYQEACTTFETTNWVLHAESSGRPRLWATMYGSHIWHQGLENSSPDDRPVLVMAFAESEAAIQSRGYVKRLSDLQWQAVAKFREVDLAPILARSNLTHMSSEA